MAKNTLDIAIISTPMGCKGGWIQGARRVAKGGNKLEKYARPLPRVPVHAIFLGRAPLLLYVEPWLITQWQTEK